MRALCASVWFGAWQSHSMKPKGRMNVRVPVTLDVAAETARCRHPDASKGRALREYLPFCLLTAGLATLGDAERNHLFSHPFPCLTPRQARCSLGFSRGKKSFDGGRREKGRRGLRFRGTAGAGDGRAVQPAP